MRQSKIKFKKKQKEKVAEQEVWPDSMGILEQLLSGLEGTELGDSRDVG